MKTEVNLVAILLTLSCVLPALETKSSQETRRLEQKKYASNSHTANKKILRVTGSKLPQQNALVIYASGTHANRPKVRVKPQKSNNTALVKTTQLQRERPRRKKHKMDRMMMALLMAYKMKFIALIPTLMGGLILLISTALLAGFFFALFAAVLGLKGH